MSNAGLGLDEVSECVRRAPDKNSKSSRQSAQGFRQIAAITVPQV